MTIKKLISHPLPIGLLAGFLSGLLGIGGGIILIPALILLLKLPQHTAQGTALFVIVLTSLSGSIGYYFAGNLDINASLWLASGAMIGMLFGALIAHSLPSLILRRLFGLIMILVALKMFLM